MTYWYTGYAFFQIPQSYIFKSYESDVLLLHVTTFAVSQNYDLLCSFYKPFMLYIKAVFHITITCLHSQSSL